MSATAPLGLAAGSVKPGPPLSNDASGLLRTVQGHVEDIRALIYCGVCVKPLYEPFTLACGHTFCYSCLTQWFISHKRKKTCPDCRASVSTQPAPAYLIREIVQIFISRAELLEGNETTKEHLSNKQAETEKIDSHKRNTDPLNGGLFEGCFKSALPFNQPINDIIDGVTRCPRCTWELEDGSCIHCGFGVEGYDSFDPSDQDDSISMTDAAEDIEDGFSTVDGDYFAELEYHMHHHHHHHHHDDMHHQDSDEEDSHDSEMSDFIDDGPIEEDVETDHSAAVGENTIISDSDSDMETHIDTVPVGSLAPRLGGQQTIHFGVYDDDNDNYDDTDIYDGNNDNEEEVEQDEDDDEDDDVDDEPVRAPTTRAAHQRRQASSTSANRASRFQSRTTTSSTRASVGDSDDDDDEDGDEGFSPPNISNHNRASGPNSTHTIFIEDDSDVPVGPIRTSHRGSRPGRIRPNQRRGSHRGQAAVSTN
ncbi:hypothetical protein AJ78_01260 [Emergomyces pasteurianus Ep9510]|uniref:RING-type domain-containing protein n=1 Tax=Emergomyces pasteurianus Ep9510 TaxID=1447872 RepID=A0A1J9QEV5_9EURO|nr:hypothetical protein AJ78_01260 [Emergomyces pasteurianus Ep9510]